MEARRLHVEADQAPETLHRARDVRLLAAEVREHAALHRAMAVHHQQIGVAARRQRVVQHQPEAIRHAGLELVAGGDRIGMRGACGEDVDGAGLAHTAAEAQLHTQVERLLQQRMIEAARPRTALDDVHHRRRAAQGIGTAPGIEGDTLAAAMTQETVSQALCAQFVEHIFTARPVLEPL